MSLTVTIERMNVPIYTERIAEMRGGGGGSNSRGRGGGTTTPPPPTTKRLVLTWRSLPRVWCKQFQLGLLATHLIQSSQRQARTAKETELRQHRHGQEKQTVVRQSLTKGEVHTAQDLKITRGQDSLQASLVQSHPMSQDQLVELRHVNGELHTRRLSQRKSRQRGPQAIERDELVTPFEDQGTKGGVTREGGEISVREVESGEGRKETGNVKRMGDWGSVRSQQGLELGRKAGEIQSRALGHLKKGEAGRPGSGERQEGMV